MGKPERGFKKKWGADKNGEEARWYRVDKVGFALSDCVMPGT